MLKVCKNVQSQNQPLKTGIGFLCKAGKTSGLEPETAAEILPVQTKHQMYINNYDSWQGFGQAQQLSADVLQRRTCWELFIIVRSAIPTDCHAASTINSFMAYSFRPCAVRSSRWCANTLGQSTTKPETSRFIKKFQAFSFDWSPAIFLISWFYTILYAKSCKKTFYQQKCQTASGIFALLNFPDTVWKIFWWSKTPLECAYAVRRGLGEKLHPSYKKHF